MSNARLGELERRLSNTIRPGTVLEADYAKARLRVTMGDNTSAWLPWLTSRAGEDRTWHAPEVGEQVIVIAPGGELSAGYVMPGGVYKNDYPANGDKPEISRTTYKDGAILEYDRENHEHLLQLPEGSATVKVGDDAQTEITPSKITAKVGDDAKTEITSDKILAQIGSDAKTEITASKILAQVGTDAKSEITASKITHTLGSSSKIEVTSGSVKITVGGTTLEIASGGITITGNVTQTGDYTQTGTMTSNMVVLDKHTHGGVMTGTAFTATPKL
jgi:phage baseplate assembly protein V